MTGDRISALPAFDPDGRVLAVIEAPRGSADKLEFDRGSGCFFLHEVLPAGSTFPFDVGFVPSTLGEDGDPLDVLVLMDEPSTPGGVVPCRLLGVLEASRHAAPSRQTVRNDRLVAVADNAGRYADCRTLRDIGPRVLAEIEAFFAREDAPAGKRFEPGARAGASRAKQLVAAGRRAFSSSSNAAA